MPDVYATIYEADPTLQERLADVLELRAADPRQQAMLRSYLSEVEFPAGARVLEVGCGTGQVSRTVARWPNVGEVIGIDPSPVFIARARELAADLCNVSFEQADGCSLDLPTDSFDAVIFHTVLCHIPEPERALAEAGRLLKPSGWLAIFDGDYATATAAVGDFDPLQVAIEATVANLVHDRWLVRRLRAMVSSAGFEVTSFRGHSYVETARPGYMLVTVERGVDFMVASGQVGEETAAALKAEARRRAETGEFYGFINYASLIARKPA